MQCRRCVLAKLNPINANHRTWIKAAETMRVYDCQPQNIMLVSSALIVCAVCMALSSVQLVVIVARRTAAVSVMMHWAESCCRGGWKIVGRAVAGLAMYCTLNYVSNITTPSSRVEVSSALLRRSFAGSATLQLAHTTRTHVSHREREREMSVEPESGAHRNDFRRPN